MIPLALASVGEKCKIKKISGNDKIRQHLQELGLVVDAVVTIVSSDGGNVILNVKGVRVALGSDLTARVMI